MAQVTREDVMLAIIEGKLANVAIMLKYAKQLQDMPETMEVKHALPAWRPWTPLEDRFIRTGAYRSTQELAYLQGRSVASVQHRIMELETLSK